VIKGKIIPSGLESLLIPEYSECKKNGSKFCPECSLGLDIKHTDVLIISQYLRPDGCMLPRRVTGLCKRMQKRIGTMVVMAHKAGLLPNLKPAHTRTAREPNNRKGWKGFNTYYDETTIKEPGYRKILKWSNFKNNAAYDKVRKLMM
jgi:small subunit ribosomal protein S18